MNTHPYLFFSLNACKHLDLGQSFMLLAIGILETIILEVQPQKTQNHCSKEVRQKWELKWQPVLGHAWEAERKQAVTWEDANAVAVHRKQTRLAKMTSNCILLHYCGIAVSSALQNHHSYHVTHTVDSTTGKLQRKAGKRSHLYSRTFLTYSWIFSITPLPNLWIILAHSVCPQKSSLGP